MKVVSVLLLTFLACYCQAHGFTYCTGKTQDAFSGTQYDQSAIFIKHRASTQQPDGYSTANMTWIYDGYYSWGLTVPRGMLRLSYNFCDCIYQMRIAMAEQKQLCTCRFGHQNNSAIAVGRINHQDTQKRSLLGLKDTPDLSERDDSNTQIRYSKGGHGPVKIPTCATSQRR